MRRVSSVPIPFSVRLGGPHPTRFGTGRRWLLDVVREVARPWSDEVKLFASAYGAGFVFVSLFIA